MKSCHWYLWNHFKRNCFSEANSLLKTKRGKTKQIKAKDRKPARVAVERRHSGRWVQQAYACHSFADIFFQSCLLVIHCASGPESLLHGGKRRQERWVNVLDALHHLQPLVLQTELWTSETRVSNQNTILFLLPTHWPVTPTLQGYFFPTAFKT